MVDKSIIFASDKEIFSIEGSSVKNISAWLSSLHFDVCRLPHYAEIFKLAGLQQIVDNTDDYLKDCICHYDVESKVLIVANPRRDYSFVYNPAQKSWSTIDLAIRGKVRDASAHWLVNSDNDIVSLSSHDQQSKGLLLTRAIKVDHPVAPNNITEIEILGDFEPYNVSIVLYGANRLNDWHLISTSKTHHLRDHNSCTYRYYRILLLTHLQPHEYIYGTKLYY